MFLAPLLDEPSRPHSLRIESKGCVLARTIETAFESATRRKGLLGRDGIAEGSALVIAPSGGIHTFFMRFAIDVLLVTRAGKAVKVRRRVGPWRVVMSLRAFAAIELPAGTLARCDVRAGDVVRVVPDPGERGEVRRRSSSGTAAHGCTE